VLRRLFLDHNEIESSIPGQLTFVGFPALTFLDLSNNSPKQLDFVSTLSPKLEVLKLSNNNIGDACEFYHLRSLVNLEEVEFDENPVTKTLSDYKCLVLVKAIILGKLATVNGVTINERDELLGKHKF
jgi:Leucine-rich repeat (LRR) protein